MMKKLLLGSLSGVAAVMGMGDSACAQNTTNFAHLGQIVRLDPRFDDLLADDAKIEVLAAGFDWAEGPVWVKDDSKGRRSCVILRYSAEPRHEVDRR